MSALIESMELINWFARSIKLPSPYRWYEEKPNNYITTTVWPSNCSRFPEKKGREGHAETGITYIDLRACPGKRFLRLSSLKLYRLIQRTSRFVAQISSNVTGQVPYHLFLPLVAFWVWVILYRH